MSIICSGSLAIDRTMSYAGLFADNFMTDKLDNMNISILVDLDSRLFGGCAGNIAYNLRLLGEKPLLAGSLGNDAEGREYLDRIKSWGLDADTIHISRVQGTAGATIITDNKNNQFTYFYPGAMAEKSGFDPQTLADPKSGHLGIVSPGGLAEMKDLCAQYRRLGVRYIFDIGQQIPAFSGAELLEMLNGALMLAVNEYELDMFLKKTGLARDDLFGYTEALIVTRGGEGADLWVAGRGSQHVMAVPVRQVVDPTGAGDAFRAGLLTGLNRGLALITACRLGATVAAFCVEAQGTQSQEYTLAEVIGRHHSTFKEALSL